MGLLKKSHNILIEVELVDGGTGLRRNKQTTTFFKNYKRQESLESHDRLRHVEIKHMKKKKTLVSIYQRVFFQGNCLHI